MKRRFYRSFALAGLSLVFAVVLTGCFGSGGETSQDSTQGEDPSKPFVEGYIIYPGPNEKWAGPQNLSIHVSTWHSGKAEITLTPSLYQSKPKPHMSIQTARDYLSRLETALKEKDPEFKGCLSPVRIMLIRADGSTVERQACRGQSGWPRVAGEIADKLLGATLNSEKNNEKAEVNGGPSVGRGAAN